MSRITPKEFQEYCLTTEKTPTYMIDVHGSFGGAGQPSNILSRLDHAAKGAVTEAGELADVLKKHSNYGKPFDKVNFVEEIGDSLWYFAIALDALGLSFEDAMEVCKKKLEKRYPNGFTQKDALVRNLKVERKILEEGVAKASDEDGA